MFETDFNADCCLLYHWTTISKALTAVKCDRLQQRKWAHYIETENRLIRGSSWSLSQTEWSVDNPVCLIANREKLTNPIYPINGNRTFWQTKGMVDPLYDPDAYELESEEPNEEFVEGTIKPLSGVLIGIFIRNLSDEETIQLIQHYADTHGLALISECQTNQKPVAF